MTRAEQNATFNFTDALIEANEIGEVIGENYDNETTTIEFGDGSVNVFNGVLQEIFTYGSLNQC